VNESEALRWVTRQWQKLSEKDEIAGVDCWRNVVRLLQCYYFCSQRGLKLLFQELLALRTKLTREKSRNNRQRAASQLSCMPRSATGCCRSLDPPLVVQWW